MTDQLLATLTYFAKDLALVLGLLAGLIALVAYLRTYISQQQISDALNKNAAASYAAAAGFGILTPFCSCSSIPIFISLVQAGAPIGPAFTFLAASPLINEFVIALMLGLFGWQATLTYVIAGISVALAAGLLAQHYGLEKHLTDLREQNTKAQPQPTTQRERARSAAHEALRLTKKLAPWVALGVGIGAVIHNYVPQALITGLMQQLGALGVPAAALLGVPMYGNGAAIVPVAAELFSKGVPLGTALAFLMSVVGLSLPEAIILRKVMNLRLIGIFFGVVATGIIVIGYLLNSLAPLLI